MYVQRIAKAQTTNNVTWDWRDELIVNHYYMYYCTLHVYIYVFLVSWFLCVYLFAVLAICTVCTFQSYIRNWLANVWTDSSILSGISANPLFASRQRLYAYSGQLPPNSKIHTWQLELLIGLVLWWCLRIKSLHLIVRYFFGLSQQSVLWATVTWCCHPACLLGWHSWNGIYFH